MRAVLHDASDDRRRADRLIEDRRGDPSAAQLGRREAASDQRHGDHGGQQGRLAAHRQRRENAQQHGARPGPWRWLEWQSKVQRDTDGQPDGAPQRPPLRVVEHGRRQSFEQAWHVVASPRRKRSPPAGSVYQPVSHLPRRLMFTPPPAMLARRSGSGKAGSRRAPICATSAAQRTSAETSPK